MTAASSLVPPPSGMVLAGGVVLGGPDLAVLDEGWVEIGPDGRIRGVGGGAPKGSTAPRLDVSGCIVCPAFVNAHTHVIDGFLKEVGFGVPYWEVFMPPDGRRHRALATTDPAVVEAQLGRTLDQMIACGTSAFADFREGGRPGVELLERVAADRPIQPVTLGRFGAYPPQPPEALDTNRGVLPAEALDEITDIVDAGGGFSLIGANDLTDEALAQVAAHVDGLDGLLALHVAESPPYRETSIERTGRSDVDRVIDHLRPDFAVHLTFATAGGTGPAWPRPASRPCAAPATMP